MQPKGDQSIRIALQMPARPVASMIGNHKILVKLALGDTLFRNMLLTQHHAFANRKGRGVDV